MRSFFKTFFAALLALVVFGLVVFLLLLGMVKGLSSGDKPQVAANAVLVLDLSQLYKEQKQEDMIGSLSGNDGDIPGLYDLIRLLSQAKSDKRIAGIYVLANSNPNGFAASDELRQALLDFKGSGKFIIAHGDVMTQQAYAVANVADKLYLSPQGFLEWSGYGVTYTFFKGTLDKLDVKPQIFYAGKFKSATEPFREEQMTEANRLQTAVWLNDLYRDFLLKTASVRKKDTTELKRLAEEMLIRHAKDAADYGLVDAIKYDDEVKDEIKEKLGLDKYSRINFVTVNTYYAATGVNRGSGDKIALLFAEGDIVDGRSEEGSIGGDTYRNLFRKARLDQSVKAIVVRINSGGGSAMASEAIWREMALARQEKPVIVSFGDVAASGGYYMACAADSIFASPVSITGSIGVFGIIPDMQGFFKNKLGVTFDGVQTNPHADAGAIYRPLTESERQMVQASVELTYTQFKQRVADGRKMDTAYVDSIAQGRVWTGMRAKEIGLVDRFGGIDDAIRSAAAMAKLTKYQVAEYPEPQSFFDRLFSRQEPMTYSKKLKEELGEENFAIYQQMKKLREMTSTVQARMPFHFTWK